jgi:hypothetical protein
MSPAVFVDTFWPILLIYLAAFVVVPLLSIVLALMERREQVRRMHRMRHDQKPGACMNDESNVIQLKLRPFHQRFIRSYRGWRAAGLSRVQALRGAWRISRLPSTVR